MSANDPKRTSVVPAPGNYGEITIVLAQRSACGTIHKAEE